MQHWHLTPYNWIVWAVLAVAALLLLFKIRRLPLPVMVFLLFDLARDVVLAKPAWLLQGTLYAEYWWSLKYIDYILKLWLLCWAATRILWDRTNFMLFYAITGTVGLCLLATMIGPPWAKVENHGMVMLVLSEAANVLCIFLGFCIALLAEEWPQPATGVGLGVVAWAVGVALVGILQLKHVTGANYLYPLPELLMLSVWWWAIHCPRRCRI